MDIGAPPTTAFFLNIDWLFLGESILSSHIILTPLVFGIMVQIFN